MSNKLALCDKSVAIVDRVIELLSIPENAMFYDQGTFCARSVVNPCETECCLAGWIVYAYNRRLYNELANDRDSTAIQETATSLMIPRQLCGVISTTKLFTGSGRYWAGRIGNRWAKSITIDDVSQRRQVQAKIAIDRLQEFKKTGR